MTAIKKRTLFALMLFGLIFIGITVWQQLSHAPAIGATALAHLRIQSERFGTQDTSLWPQSNLDWQTSPVDLSFLNAT
jgi:hypothetical protein